jgi:hypothetical protein
VICDPDEDRVPSLREVAATEALIAIARDPGVKVGHRISAAQQVLLSEWRMQTTDQAVWVDGDDD